MTSEKESRPRKSNRLVEFRDGEDERKCEVDTQYEKEFARTSLSWIKKDLEKNNDKYSCVIEKLSCILRELGGDRENMEDDGCKKVTPDGIIYSIVYQSERFDILNVTAEVLLERISAYL